MSDPALELQKATVAALKAAGGVGTSDRVYDKVPAPPANSPPNILFPYIRVGDDQIIGDDAENCADLSEVFQRIHVWSRAIGFPEAKTIAGAVRTRMKAATLTLSGFTVDVTEYLQTIHLEDPDGITMHSVVEFHYRITHS